MNDLVELGRERGAVAEQRAGLADVSGLVPALKRRHAQRITGELTVPARAARFAGFPDGLDARIAESLIQRGISQLYSHQREAWDRITAGEHVVVVTPTASGKTLCYNLAVIQAVLQQRSKALYLFPTKALAQDQVAELLEINQAGNLGIRAYTFDGDTPGDARKAVRTHGDIVISNPDMLHQGILPHHTKWAQFFENLKFVVVDEMHTYRGVFGSHVATTQSSSPRRSRVAVSRRSVGRYPPRYAAMRGAWRGSLSNTSFRYLVSTSTIRRVLANTMVLSPALIALRAMRVVWERADARRPRSALIMGGFQNSRCFSPVGAPD